MIICSISDQSWQLFHYHEKNRLMKRQPPNMVFGPARLAPRTCSPSDLAGFLFYPIAARQGTGGLAFSIKIRCKNPTTLSTFSRSMTQVIQNEDVAIPQQ